MVVKGGQENISAKEGRDSPCSTPGHVQMVALHFEWDYNTPHNRNLSVVHLGGNFRGTPTSPRLPWPTYQER